MPEVLRDLSPAVVARAIEENLYAFTPFPHKNWPGIEIHSGPEVSWCVTDIAFPNCNAAFRARLKPAEVDSTIESFISKGQARKVLLNWWIGRDSQPSNLGEKLVEHGFIHEGDAPGMAIDLLALDSHTAATPNLIITEVKDAENLKTWCHVTAAGFGIPAQVEPALLKWFSTGNRLKLPQRFFLAWLNGNPVATSLVFFAEGVAGLYFVAVVPPARNQGIGFAITREPLQEARRMGYRVGILQASKIGFPMYLKLGFKEYSKIGTYIWLNDNNGENT